MQVLYSGDQIRRCLRTLFSSDSQRRVAVVAFVGRGAKDFVPKPKGVEIYCWPEPGATSPDGIRDLIQAGATVRFVDYLHAKLYWAAGRGAIICSANLSNNALDADGLFELGVFVGPDDDFDIDLVLQSLSARPVAEAELERLERDHRRLQAAKRRLRRPPGTTESPGPRTFLEWMQSPLRSSWKFAPVTYEDDELSEDGADELEQARGTAAAEDFCEVDAKLFEQGDWALVFKWSKAYDGATRGRIRWLFVDHINRGVGEDGGDELVQLHPHTECPEPPFAIDDPFCKALVRVTSEYHWEDQVSKYHIPRKVILERIRAILER